MSMLVPPQMINTMVRDVVTVGARLADRRVLRRPDPPLHAAGAHRPPHRLDVATRTPRATRCTSTTMWVVEGLTHRYPTKVLAELLTTCPQYCGHCTRMDLVGNSTPQVEKLKFDAQAGRPAGRRMLDYLRRHPQVRDVVVSGGDVANLPWARLESSYLDELLEIDNIRDIRLATKALMALPQHWLQDDVVDGDGAGRDHGPRARGVAGDPHARQQRRVRHAARGRGGPRDARRRRARRAQPGRAAARASTPPRPTCSTCASALLDGAGIMPYYFYMCDMIPNAEHWRVPLAKAQELQHSIMGYLPGFATPRIVCDVPFVGKRWVHQVHDYDHVRGISYWTKNYRTGDRVRRPERARRATTATTTRSTPCPRRGSAGGPGMRTRTPAERSSSSATGPAGPRTGPTAPRWCASTRRRWPGSR